MTFSRPVFPHPSLKGLSHSIHTLGEARGQGCPHLRILCTVRTRIGCLHGRHLGEEPCQRTKRGPVSSPNSAVNLPCELICPGAVRLLQPQHLPYEPGSTLWDATRLVWGQGGPCPHPSMLLPSPTLSPELRHATPLPEPAAALPQHIILSSEMI